jgi:hypothetical protein
MVSEKGLGIGWSDLQPDWSVILNASMYSKFNILICGNNYYFGGTRVR